MALYSGSQNPPEGWQNGTSLSCSIDATRFLKPVNRRLHGIAIHSMSMIDDYPYHMQGLYFNMPIQVTEMSRDLLIPATRIASGYNDFLKFKSWERYLGAVSTTGYVLDIPRRWTIINPFTGNSAIETPLSEIPVITQLAYDAGYRYMEVENEPYNREWDNDPPYSRFPYTLEGQAAYVDYYRRVYHEVKRTRPMMRVMPTVMRHPTAFPYWTSGMLQILQGQFDAIAVHAYSKGSLTRNAYNNMSFEEWAVAVSIEETGRFLQYRNTFNVPVIATEFGMESVYPTTGAPRDGNIWAVVSNAYRMLLFHDTSCLDMACAWQLVEPWWPGRQETGKFLYVRPDQPGKTGFLYWLHYHFIRNLGKWLLPVTGTSPVVTLPDHWNVNRTGLLTPVMATLSPEQRRMYIVVVNASWDTEYPARFDLNGFYIRRSSVKFLKHDDLDHFGVVPAGTNPEGLIVHTGGGTISQGGTRFETTVPPHSVMFITLSA